MRKVLLSIVISGFVLPIWAFDMSVGGEVFYSSNFGGGITLDFPAEVLGKVKITTPNNTGGVNVFFDAKYVGVSIGCMIANESVKEEHLNRSLKRDLGEILYISTNFGFIIKYPIGLLETVKLFPAIGSYYEYRFTSNIYDADLHKMGRLWIKFGAGADFDLSKKMYLRSTLLYGIGLKNKYEEDWAESFRETLIYNEAVKADVNLSHGLTAKIGIGFKI
ncbi:MAG: hypothetical protein LBI42_08105 [Chitinispirillales bacterium]|jgi:hypothetical protein|nr:hypothetical protein [Chitinispirillales bacterium]